MASSPVAADELSALAPAANVPVWVVIVALVFVQSSFGAYGPIVTKFAQAANTNPLVFCVLRDSFAFPCLLLAARVSEGRIVLPRFRELPLFAILGGMGMFVSQLFYLLGVYYAGPSLASTIQPITPVWAAFAALLFRVEKLTSWRHLHTWAKFVGIAFAALGAAMTALFAQSGNPASSSKKNVTLAAGLVSAAQHTPHCTSSGNDKVVGCLFNLINTSFTALYIVLQKKFIFMKRDSRWRDVPVNVTAWAYMFGALFMVAATPGANLLQGCHAEGKSAWDIPHQAILPIIYAVVVVSTIGYLLVTWANMIVSSTLVVAFWPLQTLIALVLSYFMLGNALSHIQYLFCAMIIGGLILVVWANHRMEQLSEPKYMALNSAVNVTETDSLQSSSHSVKKYSAVA